MQAVQFIVKYSPYTGAAVAGGITNKSPGGTVYIATFLYEHKA
jgi:nicotinamide mononucleotide (NMN) deamidase PncC